MKKQLKDECSTQPIPKEWGDVAYGQHIFMLKFGRNQEGYSYQVYFNTCSSFDNNQYGIMLFDPDDTLLISFAVPSHTALPPVWNREFGFIDYLDWLAIQKRMNAVMIENDSPQFEMDLEPVGKCFYFTVNWNPPPTSSDDMLARARAGEQYQILSVFAEKKPELVQQAKDWMGISSE